MHTSFYKEWFDLGIGWFYNNFLFVEKYLKTENGLILDDH